MRIASGRGLGLGGDAALTFREVMSGEVLAALGDGGPDSVLRACVAALRAYPRPSYAIGGSPANALRESLEVKYRHAASRRKIFVGDDELLLRLHELGSEPVAVVSAHSPQGKDFYVYVTPSTLEPVGAVIMYDALSDEVSSELMTGAEAVSLIWEDAWEVLNEHFRRVAESLMAQHPVMTWSCGHSDNEAFPFRAYASFSGRGQVETDVVISVDVLKKDGELSYSADVALEDGQVLADGPFGSIQITGDIASLRDQIEKVIREAAAFIDSSEALLSKQILRNPS